MLELVPDGACRYLPSAGTYVARTERRRDAIIIGGGHNGLVTAAYLAEAVRRAAHFCVGPGRVLTCCPRDSTLQGKDVLVLERRHVVGGAAVTEELVPGFKFSRASYLAGLLRPKVRHNKLVYYVYSQPQRVLCVVGAGD